MTLGIRAISCAGCSGHPGKGVIIPLANVFETRSTAFSNYHGGTLRVEKRFCQGLTFLTTYTFSKAISDNPGFRGGGQGLSSAGAENS